MISLIKKEINSFFSSPTGYLVVGVFLVINGLFLWVFDGDYNIFDAGFADLNPFFELAPWVLLFLVPSVTMRAFSDEKRMGTLELLKTKPISLQTIVLGKYMGAAILVLIALLPTLLYIVTISDLGNPSGNWDLGSTLGSYIGLILLAITFTAVGIWASILSTNQIVAFIISLFTCFILYFGFEGLSGMSPSFDLSAIGIKLHYASISRGVISVSDILYFIGIIGFFLLFTIQKLEHSPIPKTNKSRGSLLLIVPMVLTFLGIANIPSKRLDLTKDKRYTLSEAAKNTLADVDSPITIDIFLSGRLPSEFKRLQVETEQILEAFANDNSNIVYQFINPLDETIDAAKIQQQMIDFGLKGARVEIKENGRITNETVYPWALAYFNGKTVPIGLLKNQLGATPEERVNSSIQNLEYAFADGFSKLVKERTKKVAVLKGNGELDNRYLADFISTLTEVSWRNRPIVWIR